MTDLLHLTLEALIAGRNRQARKYFQEYLDMQVTKSR